MERKKGKEGGKKRERNPWGLFAWQGGGVQISICASRIPRQPLKLTLGWGWRGDITGGERGRGKEKRDFGDL